ncbi:carbohydrate ABC transporter permease [Brachybacterium kimchii]|uniref:Carbohydrate ABC transporter permease n=1 Tax=Brachybacterium kimchii TaxID=2942909 RepID=A0ABY4N4X6_9MICO|nr:carbohydrate ABC transporter permease [Brachybacterium kimchii]UQN28916.1 carbohydrate ABC transporter permease [Brachybacterium kimchii]
MADQNPVPAAPPRPVRSTGIVATAVWTVMKVLVILWCAGNVLLLAWVAMNSFRGGSRIFSRPLELPRSLSLVNYVSAWTTSSLGRGFLNSIVLVAVCTAITVVIAAMAAYALARTRVPSAGPLTSFFAIGLGIPVQVVIVPLWVAMNAVSSFMYATVGWWDERLSLGLLYVATSLPFAVFLLTGFFRSLPEELEEAAALDGASAWTIFLKVMAPLARPGLVTAGMLAAMGLWNETLLALVFVTENTKYTLPQALLGLYGTMQYTSDWGGLFAGIVIVVIPTVLLYALLGKRLVEGMTLGAGK